MYRSLPFIPLFLALLSSCGETPPEATTTFGAIAMEMPYRITVGQALSSSQLSELQTLVINTFEEVNNVYNNWNPNSEISKFNKSCHPHTPSKELERLLNLTDNIVVMTEGRFDPTIEPLRLLWQRHLKEASCPTAEAIADTEESVGWKKLQRKAGLLHKANAKLSLDLCGIAKGYAVDLITERIVAAGYPNLYVEWGGEIRGHGEHPTGRPWRIFISHFEDTNPNHAIDYVELNNQAIATSGDYLQNWECEGVCYSHLIDPITGRPTPLSSKRVASASVIAPSCAIADGLATAALLFDTIEEAKNWAKKIEAVDPSIRFWLVSKEEYATPASRS